MKDETITVVSGLPRSGTSMMMKMLEAGGLPPLTDNLRTADEDNPRGYYEFERVKKLETDKAWLPEARGKVVKIISALLRHLPEEYDYKIIFMRRAIEEVLASQRQMLVRRGKPADEGADERMAELFGKHLGETETRLATSPSFDVLYVRYEEILGEPRSAAAELNRFLGGGLDETAMVSVVDPALYRQQRRC